MYTFEAEVSEGLEHIAQAEIFKLIKTETIASKKGAVRMVTSYTPKLLNLRTINSLYLALYFDIPRPKALLGHQHFHRLIDTIHEVFKWNSATYTDFFLSAAGSESSVLQRFKDEMGMALHLPEGNENGDLVLRLRRSGKGWEVLIRISPRPHATREWRVCNFEGALNGPVAASMIHLSQPSNDDRFVNLACGSGTLMIERYGKAPAKQILGVDINAHALNCAAENIRTSHYPQENFQLIQADIRSLPLPSGFANQIYADLPFGQLVGSHQENLDLYPHVLKEAARIAAADALFTVITHEVKLMETLLKELLYWDTEQTFKITLRGLHPRIYVLRKRNGRK